MEIKGYGDYILEQKIYQLLLESKIVYSDKFINLLKRMKSNRIASELLKIYNNDIDIPQNYIDISDQKDTISFIPDRKAQEYIKEEPETWEVMENNRHLTHSSRNDNIFRILGYNKNSQELFIPRNGTIGIILREAISTTGNIYTLFQEYGVPDPKLSVMNKEALVPKNHSDMKVWNTSRANIKIGRFVRSILTISKIAFTNPELEEFVNLYKATYDFTKDSLKQFDTVNGELIAHFYNIDRYVSGGGSLNNSCMACVDSDYFEIYTNNSQVNLVILYSDDGELKDEKYTSKKIKGRSLLWDATINGESVKFMDRIYTVLDNDVELFKQYAEKNGFWYKKSQSMNQDEPITDGKSVIRNPSILVNLDECEFDYYPYCDTMCYLNSDDSTLTNDSSNSSDKSLRDTDGGYD